MDDTFEELIDVCEKRANTYALLARLYVREVDQEFLDELRRTRWPVSTGNRHADEGFRKIATYLSNTWAGSVNELSQEFVNCFYGKGKKSNTAAYPYESVNRSPKRLLRQDQRDQVLAAYREEGLDKKEGWKEEEDHISAELEFMQILARRAAASMRDGDEEAAMHHFIAQRRFMNEHLCVWVSIFTGDLRRFATSNFYQGLADLTDGFIETDKLFLDDVVVAA